MGPYEHKLLKFDRFIVDLVAAQIRASDGGVVPVEPQVFDLVALLSSNPGRLISHDEIIEKVWRGRIVTDSAIASRINAARKALGDDGTAQRVIKTIRGRGFRFELTPLVRPDVAPAGPPGALGVEERFVVSCTPHAYGMLMKTRAGGAVSEDWRRALPAIFENVVGTHNGQPQAHNLAAFEKGSDAVKCARSLIEAVEVHCARLRVEERWAVKIGIACGTLNHGFGYALAGRMDALAHPGGICVTKRVTDAVGNAVDMEAAPLNAAEPQDGNSAFKIMRIGQRMLAKAHKMQPAQTLNMVLPEPVDVSVVALPFMIVGEDYELSDFAWGLRLDFQTAFSQLSGVCPVSQTTAVMFTGASSPEAAEALGVRYVLQGNVRAIGRKIRLVLELYDHRRGRVVWNEAYEGSLDEGVDFQQRMTARLVREIDVAVLSGEQARVWHKKLGGLKGVRIYYTGLREFFSMTRESVRSARESFELLHKMNPDIAIGATWTTLCHWFELQRRWTDNATETTAALKRWAGLAMGKEDADGQAYTALCHVHLLEREFDDSLKLGEQAVTIRPSCPNANGFYAHSLYYCGLLDKAIHHARLAIRFMPNYPPFYAAVLAGALHARGDQEAAIAIAKDSVRLNPNDGHAKAILCSALMELGREQEAIAIAVDLKRMEPDFCPIPFLNNLPFRHDDMRSQLALNCSRAILSAE
jgi:DNA-binding winged helix-turn-helix (wHTH) protein/TolB-like protein